MSEKLTDDDSPIMKVIIINDEFHSEVNCHDLIECLMEMLQTGAYMPESDRLEIISPQEWQDRQPRSRIRM